MPATLTQEGKLTGMFSLISWNPS